MKMSDIISVWSIVVTLFVGLVTWIVTYYLTKKSIKTKKLSYEMKLTPLIPAGREEDFKKFKIYYNDAQLVKPYLLSVDIINSGNIAIENPPIEIEALDATYIIPGYFEDIPPGYEDLWSSERVDAEVCNIKLEHINPGQIAKVRFYLDEEPSNDIVFKCPMKDLKVKRVKTELRKNILNSSVLVLSEVVGGSIGISYKK
jgi:hypothetical protein